MRITEWGKNVRLFGEFENNGGQVMFKHNLSMFNKYEYKKTYVIFKTYLL